MATSLRKVFIILFLFFTAGILLYANDTSNDKLVEKLASKEYKIIAEGKRALIAAKTKRIERLIEIYKKADKKPSELSMPFETKVNVMEVLGELRAVKAVPLLIENIKFLGAATMGGSTFSDPKSYPAAIALAKIGKPASMVSLKKLEKKLSNRERSLCCYVINQVEGEYAKVILETKIKNISDEKVKANLKTSLEIMEKVKKTGWLEL